MITKLGKHLCIPDVPVKLEIGEEWVCPECSIVWVLLGFGKWYESNRLYNWTWVRNRRKEPRAKDTT